MNEWVNELSTQDLSVFLPNDQTEASLISLSTEILLIKKYCHFEVQPQRDEIIMLLSTLHSAPTMSAQLKMVLGSQGSYF